MAGSTGYVGRAVVAQLRALGVRCVAHVRPDSSRLADWRDRFEALGADVDVSPWQPVAFRETLAGSRPDLVFALLGTTRKRAARDAAAGRDSSYQTVDYGMSRILLDATLVSCPQARFVYLSSLAVSGNTKNEYLAVRWKLEQELIASGLDYIIARPSFITGPDRDETRTTERVAATVVDGALRVLAALGARDWQNQFASLTGSQLGRALVQAALTPDCSRVVLETRQLRPLSGAL